MIADSHRTLSDVAEVVRGTSPSGDTCNEKGKGIPLLNGPTEFGSHHPDPVQYTVEPKKFAQPGDLLFCVRGSTTGRMNWADQEYAIGRGLAAIRAEEDKDLQPYIRALVEYRLGVLLQEATGSTFPNVSLSQLRGLEIPKHNLPTQRRIADILGALDDKIELNRRMNETLEAMAQALYRHWFVDFGPFQDREFTDTEELGPIPKGWEVTPFLDTCDIETGGTPKTSVDEYWDGDILWASAKDVSQSTETVLLDPERTVTPEGLDNSPADVLPAGSTAIVARGATTGRHAILGRDMALNQSCYGLVGKNGYSLGWTYLTVNSLVKRLRKRAYGSAFDSVTISTFENLDIVGAPPEVVSAFNEKVMPLFEKMMVNVKENQTLAKTRDYLLPKLISGEVGVEAPEKAVEANV